MNQQMKQTEKGTLRSLRSRRAIFVRSASSECERDKDVSEITELRFDPYRCFATRLDGTPCRATAMRGRMFCERHLRAGYGLFEVAARKAATFRHDPQADEQEHQALDPLTE